ncbi:MAG: glutamate--tRNA ligase [Leptospiraceae bacterium]|nr:glutamate--tRNA ligase [Leptospiraceae bacterium]MCP5499234.1 glutamate--tRNA ligase [Leptospiraceae bacterium]
MFEEVRTRFAPSPSGFLHVGGARTALFNYLYAKSTGGKFIVRVEDTDQARSTEASMKVILESLKWLGIHWDEGPEVGGEYGPYIQSERLSTYKQFTERLLSEGKAYRCFCTPEELETKKKQAEEKGEPSIYDGTDANLSEEEIQKKLEQGIPYAIRLHVPAKTLQVNDLVQGKVKFDTRHLGDFIIVKSDGFPSYNYAVVIDDYLMKISHVIRGVGHLPNTPRQIVISEALGFPLPSYAHVSEIVGTDGKKLSKRAGATSILAFRDLGYTPQCFVNYMALLGWMPEDEEEFMPDKKAETTFRIEKCSKSPATFDVFKKQKADEALDFNSLSLEQLAENLNPKSKLNWLSNKHIRHIDIKELAVQTLPFIEAVAEIPEQVKKVDSEELISILSSIRVYLDRLSQAAPYITEFFQTEIQTENEEAKKMLEGDGEKVALLFRKKVLEKKPADVEAYKAIMKEVEQESGQKGRGLFMPIRVFTTGKIHGLELPILFSLLGVDKLQKRMESIAKHTGLQV